MLKWKPLANAGVIAALDRRLHGACGAGEVEVTPFP